jgi:hypothetical protein
MKKVHYFPKPIKGKEPEANPFFTGAVIGLVICVPFWMMVVHFFF